MTKQDNPSDKVFFKEMKKEVVDYSEDITESFPYFCLKIFWDDLSADEIEEALQGLTTNDEGIDAFFIDEENKEINIIQCKSCASEKNMQTLKKDWIALLSKVPEKLRNHDLIDQHKNERVKAIAANYIQYTDNKSYKTKSHFFHLGRAVPNVLKPYQEQITYYDWDKIKDEFAEYQSRTDRTEPPEIEIQLYNDCTQPTIQNNHKTLVSVITGDEIIHLRETYRYKLFDKNLRFGLGKNKINKKITETAKKKPTYFYFYNNGITITSKSFKQKPTSNKLNIEYPQIINGAQTVNAIYQAYLDKVNDIKRKSPNKNAKKEAKEEFKQLSLLFRVIQDDSKDGKNTSNFEEEVIRYNNSQTLIKETDFYANKPEQIKLQEIFAKFGYFYEIKRGDRLYLDAAKEEHNLLKKKKKDFPYWDEKIDMASLAGLWMAYSLDPTLDKVQKKNIFDQAGQANYKTIFEDADKITDDEVKKMILAYNLFDCIHKQTEIYGNKQKGGQIIFKLAKITDEPDEQTIFNDVKNMVDNSYIFSKPTKTDFSTIAAFLERQETASNEVRRYRFFSLGKYITLAIFGKILQDCHYEDTLIKSDLFRDKSFINQYIVKAWLRTILKKVLLTEYQALKKQNPGLQIKNFYQRSTTWKNTKGCLDNLKYEEEEELTEIFPLDMGKSS